MSRNIVTVHTLPFNPKYFLYYGAEWCPRPRITAVPHKTVYRQGKVALAGNSGWWVLAKKLSSTARAGARHSKKKKKVVGEDVRQDGGDLWL